MNIYESAHLLEKKRRDGNAREGDLNALGVMLMMPPFSDYSASCDVFVDAMSRFPNQTQTITWAGYLHVFYYPMIPNCGLILESQAVIDASGVVDWILAHYYLNEGRKVEGARLIKKSIEKCVFPNNAQLAYRAGVVSGNACEILKAEAKKKITDAKYEDSPEAESIEGYLLDHWNELILGVKMTSVVWERSLFSAM